MLGELQMQMWHGGETILSCAEALEKGALMGSWNCLFKGVMCWFYGCQLLAFAVVFKLVRAG